MERAAVIGGGVVGCHVAYALARKGYETYLFERHERLGQETSSRNSGVLHAGIYYKKYSLKAGLCVEGNALSREFFRDHDVAFRETGKYIIARTDSEITEIERLRESAGENGAPVEPATPSRVKRDLPYIECVAALYSPSTAIVDAADYMDRMKAALYQAGVSVIAPCNVRGIRGNVCVTDRGEFLADLFVNSAGLYADELAAECGLHGYVVRPLKGDYYSTVSIECRVPVYPPPSVHTGTLGVHLTPTFGREVLLGPSETHTEAKDDYEIRTPREEFSSSLASMIDAATAARIELNEGYSGNRPRVYLNGERCEDFVVVRRPSNVIHLLGIESPGLTAAPALARYVLSML